MQYTDIIRLKKWFQDYTAAFYLQDDDIRGHAALKEEHTYKVVEHSRGLTDWLGLPPAKAALAEVIALFHDVGRFQQYASYRTFADHKSVDHARLGLEIVDGLPELSCLSHREKEIFRFAIANHNTMRLPAEMDEEQRLLATIIRDADKLDIYRVLSGQLRPPAPQGVSQAIVRDLLAGTQSSYIDMKTPDDRKLMRLSWVYDINYKWTLRKVIEAGYIDEIINFLPQTPEIQEIVARLMQYIAEKLKL